MDNNFNDLPWHDAELLALLIDRGNPGNNDEVRLRIVWPNGEEATLRFCDCRSIIADMNFGVICCEQIFSASVTEEEPGLVSIRQKWMATGISLHSLRCYRFETASTGSVIKIYAEGYQML